MLRVHARRAAFVAYKPAFAFARMLEIFQGN
jgi:hypothetical protein